MRTAMFILGLFVIQSLFHLWRTFQTDDALSSLKHIRISIFVNYMFIALLMIAAIIYLGLSGQLGD